MTCKHLLKLFSCIFFFYFLLDVVESTNFMPAEDWVCGAMDWDKSLSYKSANQTCYDVGVSVNECCKVHDDCYEGENTQEACDVPFCECLLQQAARSKFPECKGTVETFCFAVQLFGEKDKCANQTRFDICILEFNSCLSTKEPLVCEERMCQCTIESLLDPARAECRTVIDKVCNTSSLFPRASKTNVSIVFKEVNYFGHSMTILTACGATFLVLSIIIFTVGLVHRYMKKKAMPSSPSRTPLCTAASSDLTLIFNTNAGLLPEDEERKPTMLYP
ncbi:hypothetical protein FO519_000008 [Halicephalobus sp. NKZ332]|nr:hypothetical protein FO519_000008 [Halicephalobus sp. NKZ332]